MQPTVSPCSERERIMERYRAAIKTYHDATGSLEGLSGEELEQALLSVDQARQDMAPATSSTPIFSKNILL
jgi:hypothetical protein